MNISVNNMFDFFSSAFDCAFKNFINSCLFMQHDRLFHHCLPNEYQLLKAFIVYAHLVSLSTTGHSKK